MVCEKRRIEPKNGTQLSQWYHYIAHSYVTILNGDRELAGTMPWRTLHGSLWLGKDKGSIMKSADSCGTIHLEIKFSSKVYSKSLLKVGSLKGSVVYSLILDYQFCACVMRISGVPQLQVIYMEHLYDYK